MVIFSILIYYLQQVPAAPIQQNINSTVGGRYLNFQNGETSKVYLINSSARYGIYEEDMDIGGSGQWAEYSIKKGDPCIIIDATIRNDYDREYIFLVTAETTIRVVKRWGWLQC